MNKTNLVIPILAATSIFGSTLATNLPDDDKSNDSSLQQMKQGVVQTALDISQIAQIVAKNTVPTQLQDVRLQQLQQDSTNNVPLVMQAGLGNPVDAEPTAQQKRQIQAAVISSMEDTSKTLRNELTAQNPNAAALFEQLKSKQMQSKKELNNKNND